MKLAKDLHLKLIHWIKIFLLLKHSDGSYLQLLLAS